jgi:hypothetical protein
MKMCEGQFDTKTIEVLRAAYAEFGWSAPETFRTYICVKCGAGNLIAKNYSGVWHPESHYPPARRLANPSGKSGYYKR